MLLAIKTHPITIKSHLAPSTPAMSHAAPHSQLFDEYPMLPTTLALESSFLNSPTYVAPSVALYLEQHEINLRMRHLLLDYLCEITLQMDLAPEVFYTTVMLVDRYACMRIVLKLHFQLLGMLALWIASKLHETKIRAPTMRKLRRICCDCYPTALFVDMERHVLKSLDWAVHQPSAGVFAELYLNEAGDTGAETDRLVHYLTAITVFNPAVVFDHPPSAIGAAVAAIATAVRIGASDSLDLWLLATPHRLLVVAILRLVRYPPHSMKFQVKERSVRELVDFAGSVRACIRRRAVAPVYLLPVSPAREGNLLPKMSPAAGNVGYSYTTPPVTPHQRGVKRDMSGEVNSGKRLCVWED